MGTSKDPNNWTGDDILTGEERILEWEEMRVPAFGDVSGPYLVCVVRHDDRQEFQIRDCDNVTIATCEEMLNEDGKVAESSVKRILAVFSLLAASYNLRKAAVSLIDAVNGSIDRPPPTLDEINRKTEALMHAVAQANGFDAAIFSGEEA